MKRFAFAVLMLMSFASSAGTGDPVPLCPQGSPPDCVVPNWGQVEPGATDDASTGNGSSNLARASVAPKPQMPVQMMPTAATADAMAPSRVAAVKSVVSPQNLFPKETAALLAALKRARFNPDGSIKTGEAAIKRAAAAAAQRAGNKFTLRLYIKVPQTLAPEVGAQLDKKVDALNAVLSTPYDGGQSGTPKT